MAHGPDLAAHAVARAGSARWKRPAVMHRVTAPTSRWKMPALAGRVCPPAPAGTGPLWPGGPVMWAFRSSVTTRCMGSVPPTGPRCSPRRPPRVPLAYLSPVDLMVGRSTAMMIIVMAGLARRRIRHDNE